MRKFSTVCCLLFLCYLATVFLQSSNLQTAALATGEVQIGAIGGATVLSGVAGGQTFRIVASPSNQLPYDLVARPEVKDGKDIRGKRIGVTSVGGTTWMAANLALQTLAWNRAATM